MFAKNFGDINLLGKQRAHLIIAAKRIYYIQIISFSVLIIYLFVVISLFSLTTLLNFKIKQVEQKIAHETNTIKELSDTEVRYYLLKNKVKGINSVYDQLRNQHELIQSFFENLPAGISISGFLINETGEITFNSMASRSDILEEFIIKLEGKNIGSNIIITQARISNISLNPDGNYNFSTLIKVEMVKP